jgi:hypothetical protein
MSDSTSLLNLLAANSTTSYDRANALFNAGSPATLFGRNDSTSGALTWGYYGGDVMLSGVPTAVANATLTLIASRTQHIEAGPVSTTTSAISGITIANPCVITSTSHPYSVGDVLWIAGIVGTTQLNNGFARVTATAADTVTLDLNSTGLTAYTSGGTLARMTDAGTWALQIGRGLGPAFVAPIPLYQVITDTVAATSWADVRSDRRHDLGFAAVNVAGSVDVVATAAQSRAGRDRSLIDLTGALTGNIAFVLPRLAGRYAIRNATSGAFTLTVRTPGGTGVVVATGALRDLVCDGIDIFALT